MKRLILPVLLLLAACGTPQEQCISRNTRDLRTVEKLIAEAEGNLKRGYALEEITVWDDVWDWCYPPPPPKPPAPEPPTPPGGDVFKSGKNGAGKPSMCRKEVSRTETRPKAIDLRAEAIKLDQLRVKRRELARQAESVVAQCKALYPEEG